MHGAKLASLDEKDFLSFIGAGIASIWALELLFLMGRAPERAWRACDLVRELKASSDVIERSLANLQTVGLVASGEERTFFYRAASPDFDVYAEAAEQLCRTKPFAVMNAIIRDSDEKLRLFAKSFRLKE